MSEPEKDASEHDEPKALRFPIGRRWRFVATPWAPQWGQWFSGDWNWKNFTVLRLDIEAGPAESYKGRYLEITVGLLGFVMDFEVYDEIDRAAALSPMVRRLQDFEEQQGGEAL